MSYDFETCAHGKWLLAGEHAVLRGSPSIVFPLKDKKLSLRYTEHDSFDVQSQGQLEDVLSHLFRQVIQEGLRLTQHTKKVLGRFQLNNNIPMGVGMGMSAALCTATTQWFAWKKYIEPSQIYDFAKELEHMFHGQSSGVDVAGAIAKSGVIFKADGSQTPLTQNWQPNWYLSYSQQTGITAKCVQKVKVLWQNDPILAKAIDQEMIQSVMDAIEALSQPIHKGLLQLAAAINKAKTCFTQWGLTSTGLEQHIDSLMSAGALAAKPTGSGDGGYVLSLWQDKPPSLPFELIAL